MVTMYISTFTSPERGRVWTVQAGGPLCAETDEDNAVWLYNQDIEPQLFLMNKALGVSGQLTYMPPGGLSASLRPAAWRIPRPAAGLA